MEFIWWIAIVTLFVLSFLGIIFPLIPGVISLWGGFLIYHFLINSNELTWIFWTIMGIFTVLVVGVDVVANSYFVKKYGGSKRSERIAAIATIIGSFIIPPFGIIAVPFLAVLLTEHYTNKELNKSFKISLATIIGFLSGSLAKVIIQLVMIGIFVLSILI